MSTMIFPPLPFPTQHPTWYTPRFSTLTRPHQFHSQWLFWSNYNAENRAWEQQLPEQLRWRKKQLVGNILDVLRRLKTPPAANQYLYELAMLQHGWDDMTHAVYLFFTVGTLPDSLHRSGPIPQYIAAYAADDTAVLETLYRTPLSTAWGGNPLRPAVARRGGARGPVVRLGPVLTVAATDGEVPMYRCEVKGCRAAWWFESALKAHQMERHCRA